MKVVSAVKIEEDASNGRVGVLPVNRHLEVARMPLCQRA